jgi:hypothetical protein
VVTLKVKIEPITLLNSPALPPDTHTILHWPKQVTYPHPKEKYVLPLMETTARSQGEGQGYRKRRKNWSQSFYFLLLLLTFYQQSWFRKAI